MTAKRIDLEPWWTARIEIKSGTVTMLRNIEAPAKDAATALSRMQAALAVVWNLAHITFITQPMRKGEGK